MRLRQRQLALGSMQDTMRGSGSAKKHGGKNGQPIPWKVLEFPLFLPAISGSSRLSTVGPGASVKKEKEREGEYQEGKRNPNWLWLVFSLLYHLRPCFT